MTSTGATGLPFGSGAKAAFATTPGDAPSGFSIYVDKAVLDPSEPQATVHTANVPGPVGNGYTIALFDVTGGAHTQEGDCFDPNQVCAYAVGVNPNDGTKTYQAEYRYNLGVPLFTSNTVTLSNPAYSLTTSETSIYSGGVQSYFYMNQSIHSIYTYVYDLTDPVLTAGASGTATEAPGCFGEGIVCNTAVWYPVASHLYQTRIEAHRNGAIVVLAQTPPYTVSPNGENTPTASGERAGGSNPSETGQNCACNSDPVNTATGELFEPATDFTLAGRGPGITMSRTYGSQEAAADGPFGHGWSFPYGMRVSTDSPTDPTVVTVTQENGSQSVFHGHGALWGGDHRTLATLTVDTSTSQWVMTRKQSTVLRFQQSNGALASVADPNGEAVTVSRDANGKVGTVTDASGRTAAFAYNTDGHVTTVTGPTNRVWTYAYTTAGDLASVTDPTSRAWFYGYDGQHRMTTKTSPRGGVTTTEYGTDNRVSAQTDELGHRATFVSTLGATETGTVTFTNRTGDTTVDTYTSGLLTSKTLGSGTSASTWTYAYDPAALTLTTTTDPNNNVWTYASDSYGNRTLIVDPLGNTTRLSYGPHSEPTAVTDPTGITTTVATDTRGNPTASTVATNNGIGALSTTYAHAATGHPGDVTSVTDPAGDTTTFAYDSNGNPASVTSPTGSVTTSTNDPYGRRLTQVSPNGNVSGATASQWTTTLTYDAAGRPMSVTDPLGYQSTATYNSGGDPTPVTDIAARTTTNVYDAAGQVTASTLPGPRSIGRTYDAEQRPTTTTDPVGSVTTLTYDQQGRVATAADAIGTAAVAGSAARTDHTVTYGYDPAGNLIKTTRGSLTTGHVTTAAYDTANRLVSVTDPAGGVTATTHDAAGRATVVTDPNGHATNTAYDGYGRPVSVTDPNGHVTTTTYDSASRIVSVTDPAGGKTTYLWDADSRLVSTVDPVGNTSGQTPASHQTSYVYDRDSNRTKVTDPLGRATDTAYDRRDQPSSTTDALGHTTSVARDQYGRVNRVTAPDGGITSTSFLTTGPVSQVVDQNNHTTTWQYDLANHPTKRTDPAGNVTTWTNNRNGQPVTTVTGKGNAVSGSTAGTIIRTFDGYDRLAGVAYSDGTPSIGYGYDTDNRRTQMTDGTGTSAYAYDTAGQLTSYTRNLPTAVSIGYAYDPAGNVLTRTRGDGTTETSAYDPADRQTSLAWADRTDASKTPIRTATWTYDSNSRPTTVGYPGGASQTRQYDAADEVTNVTNKTGAAAVESSLAYTYDQRGNASAQTVSRGSAVDKRAFSYDLNDRLTRACYGTNGCTSPTESDTWAYDKTGNRTQETSLKSADAITRTWAYAYDTPGRLSTRTESTVAGGTVNTEKYTYDADGNTTAQTNTDLSGSSYTWDAADHLKKSSDNTATVQSPSANVTYDGDGNRIGGPDGPETYDPNGSLPRLLTRGSQRLATANDGTNIGYDDGTPGNTAWNHNDLLGSATDVTNSTGTPVLSYDYSAFGGTRAPPGATPPTTPATAPAPLGYTGGVLNTHTAARHKDAPSGNGLVHLGARDHDPTLGQFTSPDPLGGLTDTHPGSLYAYANSNPYGYTDPSGLGFLDNPVSSLLSAYDTARTEAGYQINAGGSSLLGETGRAVSAFGDGASFGLASRVADAWSPGAGCIIAVADHRYGAANFFGKAATVTAGGAGAARWAAWALNTARTSALGVPYVTADLSGEATLTLGYTQGEAITIDETLTGPMLRETLLHETVHRASYKLLGRGQSMLYKNVMSARVLEEFTAEVFATGRPLASAAFAATGYIESAGEAARFVAEVASLGGLIYAGSRS